eukprot:scaffold865_cov87-Cylindrotheca_fusiformis.AAC.8
MASNNSNNEEQMMRKKPTNQQESAPSPPSANEQAATTTTTTTTTTPAEEAAEASNEVDSGNPITDPTETLLENPPAAAATTTTTAATNNRDGTTRVCLLENLHGYDSPKHRDRVHRNGALVMNNHDVANYFAGSFIESIATNDMMKFSGFKTFKEAMSLILRQIQLGYIELSYQEGKDDDEGGASSSSTRTVSKYESPRRVLGVVRAMLLGLGTSYILKADDEKHHRGPGQQFD